jgi:tryptophan 2,3-dioxygenase
MDLKPEIIEKIKQLEEKYAASGQDMSSYLEGLLYADYLTYWDYVHLDTLLSLQSPRTSFKDEPIFIIYHQITELYFKLVLHEAQQICDKEKLTASFFEQRVDRMIRYFDALVTSFDVMVDGMEKDQFLKFRMSLLPASGFQSAQYRMIEIASTTMYNLVDKDLRSKYTGDESCEELYENIYWKKGATELATGKKTLTLIQFEEKYTERLIRWAKRFCATNLWSCYNSLPDADKTEELKNKLKTYDLMVNVKWPLSHYKSAVRYLQRKPEDIMATGGTNWQKYLPPRFQKRIFFPELWTEQEKEEWGKGWVEEQLGLL